jgi:SEC-C motif domain protein
MCYCDSLKNFDECCAPIIKKQKKAGTATELMRSRYSAYATNAAQYIVDTYHSSKRSEHTFEDIRAWAGQTKWLKLEVTQGSMLTLNEANKSSNEQVRFTATYLHDKRLYKMSELSSFSIEDGEWRYLDGTDIEHTDLGRVKSNDNCPCLSGKKFKKCCLLTLK